MALVQNNIADLTTYIKDLRRSKDPGDRLAWITQLRALHHLYHHKEAAYWEQLVSRNAKNPKRLWSSISGLLGRTSRPLETLAFSANDFLDMLTTKSDRLRASTADSPPPTFTPTFTICLRRFQTHYGFGSLLSFDIC